MLTGQYVSIDYIIEGLKRRPLPGMTFNPEELNEWAWQALTLIGVKTQYIEVSKILEIVDGKAKLPTNIQEFGNVVEVDSGYSMDEIPLNSKFYNLTYKLNNNHIYTDFQEGKVQLNYYSFPMDEEGKVMIPDNIYFIKAVDAYIRKMLGERLLYTNHILGNHFQLLEREWSFYVTAAKNDTKMMRTDRLFGFRRKHLKAVPNFNRRNN